MLSDERENTSVHKQARQTLKERSMRHRIKSNETHKRRHRQDRSVVMRMDNVLVERVDLLAARERTTRSAIVRRLLLDLLKEDDVEQGLAQ